MLVVFQCCSLLFQCFQLFTYGSDCCFFCFLDVFIEGGAYHGVHYIDRDRKRDVLAMFSPFIINILLETLTLHLKNITLYSRIRKLSKN